METGIRIYEMQDRNLQKKGNKMNKKAVACMMASAVFSMFGSPAEAAAAPATPSRTGSMNP